MSKKNRVLEIAELVMEINETTKHHVFMDISPHTEGLYIQVHCGGWKRGAGADQNMCIYYEYEEECEDAKKQLLTLLEAKEEEE